MNTFPKLVIEFTKNYQAIEDAFNAKWNMDEQSALHEIYWFADDTISESVVSYVQDKNYTGSDFLHDTLDVLDYFRTNIDRVQTDAAKTLINSLYDVTREFYMEASNVLYPQSLL